MHVEYPEPGKNILKFHNYQNVIDVSIWFVWDAESVQKKISNKIGKSTLQHHSHKCSTTGVYLMRFDDKNKCVSYLRA